MQDEITEQQAREAAVLQEEHSKRFFEGKMMGMEAHQEWGNATTTLIEFAKQELSRREAERAERAKPIDAEWLKSIGAKKKTINRWYVAPSVGIHLRDEFEVAFLVRIGGSMKQMVTRGQLLDLLRALKGGAS